MIAFGFPLFKRNEPKKRVKRTGNFIICNKYLSFCLKGWKDPNNEDFACRNFISINPYGICPAEHMLHQHN